jgi:hypothetical protein
MRVFSLVVLAALFVTNVPGATAVPDTTVQANVMVTSAGSSTYLGALA